MTRHSRLALAGTSLALGLLAMATPHAHAQVPTLDRVDSLVTAGDYTGARTTIDRWWSARDQFEVPGSDKARALMLRAQLAPTPDDAEPDYLAVVLGYPTSPHAPQALLRLGQALLARGDAFRAAAYLERLDSDYPGRADRDAGLLWLARANTAARRPAAACRAAREGLRATVDPDIAAMLRVEEGVSCSVAARQGPDADAELEGTPTAGPQERPADGPGERVEEGTVRPGEASVQDVATGEWAVQTGAFRYRRGAERLMERLRGEGYRPRLVRVPGSDLLRVRLGRFASSDDASALVARLRGQDFEAVAVNDVRRELEP